MAPVLEGKAAQDFATQMCDQDPMKRDYLENAAKANDDADVAACLALQIKPDGSLDADDPQSYDHSAIDAHHKTCAGAGLEAKGVGAASTASQ